MTIQQWSEGIWVAEMHADPNLTEELQALLDQLELAGDTDLVLNLGGVDTINSAHIAQLLQVRRKVTSAGRRLRLCCLQDSVWGALVVTGIAKLFEASPDPSTALASIQLGE